MEIIISYLALITLLGLPVFCAYMSHKMDENEKRNKNVKYTQKRKNYYDDDSESDEEFFNELAETQATMNMLYGGFSSDSSAREEKIERKREKLNELEKKSDWQRQCDPAWDNGSDTKNNWDSEETKLDKDIGNMEQKNISYGNWMDFEDRRTYKDESDTTEMPDEYEYGG